ncbi:MAG: hypothetical protein LUE29_03070 [Lachnospiraceae bacterium]|nr:hypothetical protein [Lachnospiraceae bacterium]
MRDTVKLYMERFRAEHRRIRRRASVLMLLALIVAAGVYWQLHSTGIALTNETFCGLTEHRHSEECYEKVPVCGLEESEEHTHAESCYEEQLVCGMEEHTHTIACMSNENADLETEEDWEATLPSLTGVWPDDVAAIAESQLGYTESTENYTVAEDGETVRGYTRYGAWAGNEYGAWDAMFASFCLHYAGISTDVIPEATGAYAWSVKLQEAGIYINVTASVSETETDVAVSEPETETDTTDNTPQSGDLVFFDENGDGRADAVGIVTEVSETEMTVIEGDSNDAVEENNYSPDSAVGYVDISAAWEEYIESCGAEIVNNTATETDADEAETQTYTACDGILIVTVTAPAGALPEDAALFVELYGEGSDAYTAAGETVNYDADDEDTAMAAVNISFRAGGEEIEPAEAVNVTIDASALIPAGADTSTIEVNHLTETEDGVEADLVAESGEGVDIDTDTDTVTVEFEVESFSTFTITWSTGNSGGGWGGGQQSASTSITATTYLYGTTTVIGSESTSLTGTSGTAFDLTSSNTDLALDGYTLVGADITYNGTTYEDVTAITVTITTGSSSGPGAGGWGGNTTTYTYSYTDSSGNTVQLYSGNTSQTMSVSLYYEEDAGISITSCTGSESEGYTLTAETTGSHTYSDTEWSVDDTSIAEITVNSDGTATVTWTGAVSNGDTVTVTAESTYTDSAGETVTVSDTYTLYYGITDVTFTVYYPTTSGTSARASGVTVYVYDSSGNLVDSGTTNSNGNVTFELANGATYTVETSDYTSTYTYSYSGEVTADAVNGNVIHLVRDTSSGTYEHIDIKNVAVSGVGSTLTLSSITSVVVYDSSGNQIYYTASITHNSSEENWQCIFASSGSSSGSHSISFDTDYTVVITYVASDGNTYYATIDSSTTYPEGSYYPADGARAYQLYNYLYGTSYTSSNWTSSSAYAAIEDTGIDVSGLTYFEVAIVLCDSWGAQQNGLDFALDIESLLYLSAGWDFEVQKTLENGSMEGGEFTFNLYEADVSGDGTWTLGSLLQSQTNSAAMAGTDGTSEDTVSFTQVNYSTSDAGTYYYILSETQGDGFGLTYDETVYGVKVVVTVTSSTVGNVTTYTTTVTATYYTLTAVTDTNGDVTYTVEEEITLDASTGGVVSFAFTNTFSADITIKKVDYDDESATLAGAVFTLDGVEYTTDENGEIHITGLGTGTYTLTETEAPDGYYILGGDTTITVTSDGVEVSYDGNTTSATYISYDGDTMTITVRDKGGDIMPSAGGIGNRGFFLAGLFICGGAALLLYRRRRIA